MYRPFVHLLDWIVIESTFVLPTVRNIGLLKTHKRRDAGFIKFINPVEHFYIYKAGRYKAYIKTKRGYGDILCVYSCRN